MMRALLVVLGVVASSISAARADANSTKVRKNEPVSIGISTVNENEGLVEANIGYSFGEAFDLTLVSSRGISDLEQDFSNEFRLVEYAYLFGGRRDL